MKNNCLTVRIPALLVSVWIVATALAEGTPLQVRGMWIVGAEGIQTSGLSFGSDGALWTVGDQNTKVDGVFTDKRLFRIVVRSGYRSRAMIDSGKIIYDGTTKYDGDFEGICRAPTEGTFFAITESFSARTPRKPAGIFEFNRNGRMIQGRTEMNLKRWHADPHDPNEALEGIAFGEGVLFLAHEKKPRILMISLDQARRGGLAPTSRDSKITPSELDANLSGVDNLNGLEFVSQDGKNFLLAVARNQQLIVAIELQRTEEESFGARNVRKKTIRLMSPDSDRELCWASPEGIAVNDGRVWLISDPPSTAEHHYRELEKGEVRHHCEARSEKNRYRGRNFEALQPILFSTSLSEVFDD